MARASREVRLKQARECLESGETIKQWAAEHGVSAPTMYAWVRRFREVESRSKDEPAFIEVAAGEHQEPSVQDRPAPSIICHVGTIEAAIYPGTSEYDILAFLEAATSL